VVLQLLAPEELLSFKELIIYLKVSVLSYSTELPARNLKADGDI
jgi:hypothetical protein